MTHRKLSFTSVLLLVVLVVVAVTTTSPAYPQDIGGLFGPSTSVRHGTSDPATCQPAGQNVFINRNSTPILKICTAANTWSLVGVSSPLLLDDGTAAAPSYSFTSDPDTGMFRSAANALGFSTGGVERWVINASGAFNPIANNTYDIGNGSVNPRDIHIARNAVIYGATSGSATVAAPAVAGTTTVTLPNASSTLPIFGQQITFSGPTAARTYTLADGNRTLAPLTTAGDLMYFNGTDNIRLALGTAAQQMRVNAGATAPEWFTPASSSLPVVDTTSVVEGSVDATKEIRFEVDGLTTGTVRVITPLDANFTMARQDAAQTFTGVQTFTDGVHSPGAGSNSQRVGSSATAAGSQSAAFGVSATAPADFSVAAGYSSTSTTSQDYGTAIGWDSTSSGHSSTAIGAGTVAGHTGGIAIGRAAATTAGNQAVFGSETTQVNDLWIGQGVAANDNNEALRFGFHTTRGSGADSIGSNIVIAAGESTGAGAGGDVILQTTPRTASSSTVNTLADRDRVIAASKTLTESLVTTIMDIALASNTITGGTLYYTIEANDATDYQSLRGHVNFAAVNKAGTITTSVGTASEAGCACSASTLTNTTTITTGASKIILNLNAVSGLTQTTLRATFRVLLDGGTGITTRL